MASSCDEHVNEMFEVLSGMDDGLRQLLGPWVGGSRILVWALFTALVIIPAALFEKAADYIIDRFDLY